MAAISLSIASNPNRSAARIVSGHRNHLVCHFASRTTFSDRKFLDKCSFSTSPEKTRNNQSGSAIQFSISGKTSSDSHSFDVVVVGAGIIGLTIARQFLIGSDLSVAVVDAAVPCSGATGAGQGYIWMVHKTPGTDKWELAMRSRKLWEIFAASIQDQGIDPQEILGWKKTGSLLVGKSSDDLVILKRKVELLSEAGLNAEFLSSSDLLQVEPALALGQEGGAAFLRDDYQLDAKRTVAFIEKGNRKYAEEGRYGEYYNEPVTGFLRSGRNGKVIAVQTTKTTLHIKKAVVIATGCWTTSLIRNLIRDSDIEFTVPVKPRKGHLLVLENFSPFKLNHGLMEVGYVGHQAASLHPSVSDSNAIEHAQTTSISMTATMDTFGNLVLGSSRQLVGYNMEIDDYIINRIWERASEFFPMLREFLFRELLKSREVRVGLRPYMPDGKPVIGPVPGISNVFLAAGHEGEGLTLALGTAEMVADMVLGNPGEVDIAPFSVDRLIC